MRSAKAKPATIDGCLAGVPPVQRAVLEKLRRTIHAAAPGAEECISYGLPAFRLNGRALVAFAAWKNHCALYPMSSAVASTFAGELKSYGTSKGTIRFPTDKPLPASLVRRLVRARIAENAEHAARSKPAQKTGERPANAAKGKLTTISRQKPKKETP